MASATDFHEGLVDYNPSLGVLSLATMLEFHGHSCEVKDYCYEPMDADAIVGFIEEEGIRIVTITTYTINVDDALSFAKFLKKSVRGITIIMGGPHITLDVSYCYKSRYVDYCLKGEGEASIVELIEGILSDFSIIRADQVAGICYHDNRGKVENETTTPIENLDLLPIVNRNLADFERYTDVINISSSRGCPAKCIYCAGSVLGGRRYRMRNIDNVVLEIIRVKSQLYDKIRLIYFIDDTFTVVKKRIYRYLKLRKLLNLGYLWRCESRLDTMDKDVLDVISDNGCLAIHFGVESGSQYVLDRIQKRIDLERAVELIRYASTKKMLVCCYFMIGHYCDTLTTMEQTCELIKTLVVECNIDASLHYNTPYPGTYQYNHMEELGIRLISEDFRKFVGYSPIMETDHFTVEDQNQLYRSVNAYLNRRNFTV